MIHLLIKAGPVNGRAARKNVSLNRSFKSLLSYPVASVLLCLLTGSGVAADSKYISQSLLEASQHGHEKVKVIAMMKAPSKNRPRGWVGFNDYVKQLQDQAINELGWVNLNQMIRYANIPALAMSVDQQQLQSMVTAQTIAGVYQDRVEKVSLQNSIPAVGSQKVWKQGIQGSGQTVAVLDTGVDANHPFLREQVIEEACFSSNSKDSVTLCPNRKEKQLGMGAAKPCEKGCEHGTHVAGIVAGNGASFTGVAPKSKILAVQVFHAEKGCDKREKDCVTGAYLSDILQGLDWVYSKRYQYNIAAVNLSLGGGKFEASCDRESWPYAVMIDLLKQANIATVVASGNESFENSLNSPACVTEAVSVGAYNGAGGVASFSNSSPFLDLLAPGQAIHSSIPGLRFAKKSGTSMAAPHVAGAFALMRSHNQKISVDEMVDVMMKTGDRVTDAKNGVTTSTLRIDKALGVGRTKPAKRPILTEENDDFDGLKIERNKTKNR